MTATEMGADAGGPTRVPSQNQLRVASLLMTATLAAGAVGFVSGAVKLPDEVAAAEAVAIWSVGVVGVLSWFRHFIFYRGDAARMGWTGGFAGFQWEVGYANLGFGLTALAAVFGDWGANAVAATVVGYGLYLLQAGVMHVWQPRTSRCCDDRAQDVLARVRRVPALLRHTGTRSRRRLALLAASPGSTRMRLVTPVMRARVRQAP